MSREFQTSRKLSNSAWLARKINKRPQKIWSTHLIFVTTITTARCVKNLAKYKIFLLEREKNAWQSVYFTHSVKFYAQFFARQHLWQIYGLSIVRFLILKLRYCEKMKNVRYGKAIISCWNGIDPLTTARYYIFVPFVYLQSHWDLIAYSFDQRLSHVYRYFDDKIVSQIMSLFLYLFWEEEGGGLVNPL